MGRRELARAEEVDRLRKVGVDMCGWSCAQRVCEGRLGLAVHRGPQSAGSRACPDGKRAWNEARAVEMWRAAELVCGEELPKGGGNPFVNQH